MRQWSRREKIEGAHRRRSLRRRNNELLRGWNVLDESHLHGAPLPGCQDLANALTNETVPGRDGLAVPSQDEVELNQPPLQIRPVVFFKGRYRGWETDAIGSNGLAESMDRQRVEPDLVQRRKGAFPAASSAPGRIHRSIPGLPRVDLRRYHLRHTLSVRRKS